MNRRTIAIRIWPLIALALCALRAWGVPAMTPSFSMGAAINFGHGIYYVPYDSLTDYSIDPAVEAGLLFAGKHRISVQGMLITSTDQLLFPKLSTGCVKFSANYGYQFLPGAFFGPHVFYKGGSNRFNPDNMIDPTYTGSLRDKFTFLGGGATLSLEPLKHLAVQIYLEYNHEVKHTRTNDITDKFTGEKWEFPSGKNSYASSGVIFSAKFKRLHGG